MKIVRAETAGFCMGVSLALRRLDAALQAHESAGGARSGSRLATLGPVIHNPRVIAAYAQKGVVCLTGVSEARPGDTVLIRAHGVPREEEAMLLRQGVTVLDATCPKVKRAQLAIAAEREKKGGTLLLYGEADHPEVKGLVSYADNDACVFPDYAGFETVTLDPERDYFLAAQTTQDILGFEAVCALAAVRLGHDVPTLRTICDATRKRQAEVLDLARSVDLLVVVGGANSGNTRRLAEVAEEQGIRALRIEDVTELTPALFTGVASVGLTAGASTPVEHIDAVEAWLQNV
ncbi:4-hydroxy-3-methylbut-2-enyl diphosphate reductase [uncultured delta proteobacterium]|uniref:4-hydroxy-3-methylbut-2-enyl diphosphate reductase n=1 Tax=uncultured delta proteobacterium TaxID=34034 RepID=A0A212KCL7_9DELT|nr:4-hydroxy-3-methylbut-2-enyl diphosphate reductase [uncultured delta proteobacterium]